MKIGSRLFLLYFIIIIIFSVTAVSTSWTFDFLTARVERLSNQDQLVLDAVKTLREKMDEAVRASRLAAAGTASALDARHARDAIEDIFRTLKPHLSSTEKSFLSEMETSWEKVELNLTSPIRPSAEFRDEVIPELKNLGTMMNRLETVRKETSLRRIEEMKTEIARARTRLLFLAMILAAVGILLLIQTQRRILDPLRRLVRGTDRISDGELDTRIDITTHDEIGELGEHFNPMAGRLKEAEESKMAFLSMISHDMRTPLTAIKGYAALIRRGKRGDVTDEQDAGLKTIERETEKLSHLVEDLLDVARAEAGQFSIDVQPSDPKPAIEASLEPYKLIARKKGIDFEFAIDELPEAVLDIGRVEQALRNLVNNALKFTLEGGHVEVSGTFDGKDLVFEVRDTGVGVPADKREFLFERFYQMKEEHRGLEGGLGLGLAIVREVARAHGGEVFLRPDVENGSCFVLKFRYVKPQEGIEE